MTIRSTHRSTCERCPRRRNLVSLSMSVSDRFFHRRAGIRNPLQRASGRNGLRVDAAGVRRMPRGDRLGVDGVPATYKDDRVCSRAAGVVFDRTAWRWTHPPLIHDLPPDRDGAMSRPARLAFRVWPDGFLLELWV